MGLMFLFKNIALLFLLVSSSLLSTCSFAGRHHRLVDSVQREAIAAGDQNEEVKSENLRHEERVVIIHERLLKVNTKDYGSYDPTPALGKPPFKLIPN